MATPLKITRAISIALAVSAVGVAALTVPGGDARAAAAKTIKVGDDYFVKPGGATVTVKRGTTVSWRWTGQVAHNVTGRGGPARFASRTQVRGSYSRRFTKPGTYSLICTIHGPVMTMKLRVT